MATKERTTSKTMGGSAPVAHLACSHLQKHYERMCANEAVAIRGADTEGVHRMRVASRRLRAVLPLLIPTVPKPTVRTLVAELGWLGDALGKVRDLDVLMADTASLKANGSSLRRFRHQLDRSHQRERVQLIEVLGGGRYSRLKRQLLALLGPDLAAAERPTARGALERCIRQQVKPIRRLCSQLLKRPCDKGIHKLRIRLKRLRYAFEMFLPFYGEPLAALLREFADLQEELGAFQDACVARAAMKAQLRKRGGEALRRSAKACQAQQKALRHKLLDKQVPWLRRRLRPRTLRESLAA